VLIPPTPSAVEHDNSYEDLKTGSTLKIVMPLLKSGGFHASLHAQQTNSNTITLTADDLLGYITSKYAITGKNGMLRLKFLSAQQTKDGQTLPLAAPPALPFDLPRIPEHVRLVYLVRSSQADHNMAIIASKNLNSLDALTRRVQKDPDTCIAANDAFCSWVPSGIAVRPESSEPRP
jgi:hypothetical protein